MKKVQRFTIGTCDEDITSNSGLALIGAAIKRRTSLCEINKKLPPSHHGISHSDILTSYLGVLSLGKNDFEALNFHRDDPFFAYSMQIKKSPSVERLRQRMDLNAKLYRPFVEKAAIDFLVKSEVKLTATSIGHVPVDIDVSCMDNSNSQKEGVSYTYKGFDGYAPIMGYIGEEGYCLALELREGKQHVQAGSNMTIKRVINRACKVTKKSLLMRMDAGHDDTLNFIEINKQAKARDREIAFIIKWNPRQKLNESYKLYWLNYAAKKGYLVERESGNRTAIFDILSERIHKKSGLSGKFRRVMRVREINVDKDGQILLVPEIKIEGWWTSLDISNEEVIKLYDGRGTSEQYHSELKTDLDLERLPSGKFATNQLVLSCAMLVYNILRWLGQEGLTGRKAPIKHKARRRRIRTVIQHLMYFAARLIKTGRRLKIAFGKHAPCKSIYEMLYYKLAFQ